MRKLKATDPLFKQQLEELFASRDASQQSVAGPVREIIEQVKKSGDKALAALTEKFDGFASSSLRLSHETWQQEAAKCPDDVTSALMVAAQRIAHYSNKQLPKNEIYTDELGVELGWTWQAVESAGLYVPGGLAAYPSSVLMNAVPAKTTGVKRLVVTVPCPKGALNPVVLKACEIAGVDEVYMVGGAQAVAALAYGTETIEPVDVIVGPGNAYVAEAKRQVFGRVGIDMIAGPSEVLIVADSSVPASWVAYDMLAQAEHDARAQSIAIVETETYADQLISEVEKALKKLPKAEIAGASIEEFGAVIIVEHLETNAADIINSVAPEHLQLAVKHPETIAKQVKHAGAIFLGALTTEAIGDYIAGPSHVLPTSGTARYASGLSVFDFLKRSSWIKTDEKAFAQLVPDAIKLAEHEGLEAHANSMRLRLGKHG